MSEDKKCSMNCASLTWWATLVVAVLAVPAIAAVVAVMIPMEGFAQLSIFIVACWICTYLGMRLMSRPAIQDMMRKKD